MSDQSQLTLPYREIGPLAGRQDLRDSEIIKQSTKVAYTIPFDEIKIRDGFNQRDEYKDIEELADSLLEHGQLTEFDLDVEKDADGKLIFYIFRGHRRHKAYSLNVERGKFNPKDRVRFFPTPSGTTELFRMVDQYVSNHHQMKFSVLAQASVAYHIKHNFGEQRSHDEVAKLMGISRQKVDMLILISEASDDIKDSIKNGSMNMTDAVAFIRRQKKDAKDADKKEMDSHVTSAAMPSPPEDALKEDMQGLAELDEQAEKVKAMNKLAQEKEHLLEIADEVLIEKDLLEEKEGKQLAADVYRYWTEDLVDEDTGDVQEAECKEIIFAKGTPLDKAVIERLIEAGPESVFVYKKNPISDSVITTIAERQDKPAFDENREEIVFCQNVIKNLDKIEAIITKIDCIPDGSKKDVTDLVGWTQRTMVELRDWVQKNKKR